MNLIGSFNANVGMHAGIEILSKGGSALDAIEAVTRLVEDNPDDHSVGYSGYPNLLGEVELDASIMEGTTLRAGCIGAIKGYRHPISIARRVMTELPHVMIVDKGAERFAEECGEVRENLLTPEVEKTWRDGLEGNGMIGWSGIPEMLTSLLRRSRGVTRDPEHATGTVDVMALDGAGHIASAVSTSGWAWKYPGRLGDSPIIGAGNYCDDRYGACGCTGWGEAAIRAGTARSVVLYMKMGMTVEAACREAFADLHPLLKGTANDMNLVAMDRHGNACGMTSAEERQFVVWRSGMTTYEVLPRIVVVH